MPHLADFSPYHKLRSRSQLLMLQFLIRLCLQIYIRTFKTHRCCKFMQSLGKSKVIHHSEGIPPNHREADAFSSEETCSKIAILLVRDYNLHN